MKAVILAGGIGTRLSEETTMRPKPMAEIGGNPILWHIMKIYSHYGINEFIICLGYKGYVIKEYFANYFLHRSDVTIDIAANQMQIHNNQSEPWKVTLVDTGSESMTGGRLRRVKTFVGHETFCFTYGDGVSDVNINELIQFHRDQGKLATLTAVNPPGRFGALEFTNDLVTRFKEKPQGEDSWINGGFFVLEPDVFDLIEGDATIWELEPLERLAASSQLAGFRHHGFWHPMDTLRDKLLLEEWWSSSKAPWKVW
ncbi:glucose-1-phosphate cytidylyltransferase [Paenibacillus radicis (ex Xue et al. 2023)]|uniref:Glucose-1-phosphate cytidylyltransferase n=1 Tax=Paenibacillus radicis (ex Xue et al. 2023) TaxID=2972489 RepID=A0ABT1YPC7_9BACL|nr:glucose-1-phosphate cytidylyltransferase [Paenibacillus radicis (ex Xue et al. 2023)]MCR8635033.1 glucose-1-phosphate cytidylyltransferase [Paenibacillus radicis (ex Xue et al. 2023)]